MPTIDELAQICRSYSPFSLAAFYNWIGEAEGIKLPPHLWPVCLALCDVRIRNLQIILGPGSGKALENSTKVLTDQGWRRIDEICVGDTVYTPSGKPDAKVKAVIPQPPERLYKFTFDDGRVIKAHRNHLWKVSVEGDQYSIKSTAEILKIMREEQALFYIPLTAPTAYGKTSIEERWEFVRNYITKSKMLNADVGCCIEIKDAASAKDLQEILWSLGCYAKFDELSYTLHIQFPIPERIIGSKPLQLRIESIEQCEEEEGSTCISLDNDEGLFIAENYIVTHNSYLLSTVYPAWLIGHDPTETFLAISAGENLPIGFMLSVMRIIEHSDAFKFSYPNVKSDKAAGWSTERGIFVSGHSPSVPDSNYFGCGLNSSALTGKHARNIICDDIHDKNNAASAESCKKVITDYHTTVLGRAVATGTRFITAGRRWNNEDLYGALMNSGYYVTMCLPYEREGSSELYWDVDVPDDMECVFTDHRVLCKDGTWVDV